MLAIEQCNFPEDLSWDMGIKASEYLAEMKNTASLNILFGSARNESFIEPLTKVSSILQYGMTDRRDHPVILLTTYRRLSFEFGNTQ